jgi:hypothetical protein
MNEAALDILKKHIEISLSQSTFSTAIVGFNDWLEKISLLLNMFDT